MGTCFSRRLFSQESSRWCLVPRSFLTSFVMMALLIVGNRNDSGSSCWHFIASLNIVSSLLHMHARLIFKWTAQLAGVYTLLAVASTASVHQIQRSSFSTFTLGPCLCLPSSPVSTFSKLPSVWRHEQGVWLVQPSLHAWRAHLGCWPNRSVIREGLSKVTRVVHRAASMREEIVVGNMPRHTGAEGKTNGMPHTNTSDCS